MLDLGDWLNCQFRWCSNPKGNYRMDTCSQMDPSRTSRKTDVLYEAMQALQQHYHAYGDIKLHAKLSCTCCSVKWLILSLMPSRPQPLPASPGTTEATLADSTSSTTLRSPIRHPSSRSSMPCSTSVDSIVWALSTWPTSHEDNATWPCTGY